MNLNHAKLIPTTIIKVCTNVETHDINAAPAFVLAFARPERTSKPRLAIVAVLETKPDAKEESNKAFLEDKSRFAICARACTNKIKVSNFKMTCGFRTGPQKGLLGTKGKAIKSNASKKIPSRNSDSVIH
ncbi:Uncharacterised protein [Acinetobacter baumannii]|nr:Uncharacterised protein [Acinetobacter baumannii]